jgi:hypothetical protein
MPRSALRPILFALVLVVAWVGVTPAMAQAVARSLVDAVAAFEAGDYRRAATLARMAGDRAAGVERESARYLEGTALLKVGDLAAAANALRAAVASTDRFIAGQANISLASVEVERRNWDAAGHAYRRAAAFLQGAQAIRAHSFAARCFDEAGMGGLAAAERDAAGEREGSGKGFRHGNAGEMAVRWRCRCERPEIGRIVSGVNAGKWQTESSCSLIRSGLLPRRQKGHQIPQFAGAQHLTHWRHHRLGIG